MGIKERQVRQKEVLRQDILDAARDLFIEEGFENTSMRKIAERIEYSPTTIYNYFDDKSELLYCLVEETFAKLYETLNELNQEFDDPLECLRRSGRTYVDFGLKYPDHYKVAFMLPIRPQNEREKARYLSPESMGQVTFNVLRALVAECVRRGKFRSVDVEMTAQVLLAAVHGVTSLLITMPEYPWVERDTLIDYALDSALRGFE